MGTICVAGLESPASSFVRDFLDWEFLLQTLVSRTLCSACLILLFSKELLSQLSNPSSFKFLFTICPFIIHQFQHDFTQNFRNLELCGTFQITKTSQAGSPSSLSSTQPFNTLLVIIVSPCSTSGVLKGLRNPNNNHLKLKKTNGR